MAFKIGFAEKFSEEQKTAEVCSAPKQDLTPRKSVVSVYFEKRNTSLTYYNDRFDLRLGDLVYVEGKLEGVRGRVTELNYNFKIKVSDYKRIIAVADTDVKGEFFMAGNHFVTFEKGALPAGKALAWFKAPTDTEDEIASGEDDGEFHLDDLSGMNVSPDVAQRGHDYYLANKVRYICLDAKSGYAIVEGGETYEVEFKFEAGKIKSLTCSCFCTGKCKHEFAALLQLKETLELIEKQYSEKFARSGYFAAINKGTLFAFAVDGKENGGFTL